MNSINKICNIQFQLQELNDVECHKLTISICDEKKFRFKDLLKVIKLSQRKDAFSKFKDYSLSNEQKEFINDIARANSLPLLKYLEINKNNWDSCECFSLSMSGDKNELTVNGDANSPRSACYILEEKGKIPPARIITLYEGYYVEYAENLYGFLVFNGEDPKAYSVNKEELCELIKKKELNESAFVPNPKYNFKRKYEPGCLDELYGDIINTVANHENGLKM